MKQSSESSKSLAMIVSHPLRRRCWVALMEKTASPNQLRRELKAELADVAYHIRALAKVGAVELVETKQVGGAVEHFYRAVQRLISDDEDTAARSLESCMDVALLTGQLAFADVALALDSGSLCRRRDHCVVRVPVLLDEEGWDEMKTAYAEVLEKTMAAHANSLARMGPDEQGIPATGVAMFFERPTAAETSSCE